MNNNKSRSLPTVFYLILVLISVSVQPSQAQDSLTHKHFRFFEIKGMSGRHIYTGESLTEALANGYGAIVARYGWQSNNPNKWESMYLYPAYGFGWYSGFIGNPEMLGNPNGVFGFISFPLFKHPRHQMVVEPALGISYDFEPYDEGTNAKNDAIGSSFNVYINFNIGAKYRLNREIDLLYGIDFTHFSNGRKFKPNKGLNMFGPNLGFRYHYNSKQGKVDNSYQPQHLLNVRPTLTGYRRATPIREGRFQLYAAGGWVQNDEDKGTPKQYTTYSAVLEYTYYVNVKNAFTIGVNRFFDNSLQNRYPDKTHEFYGFHGGYDFMFWRLSTRLQVGTYTLKGRQFKGDFFFRTAIKYDINDYLYAQMGLKTMAGAKADWGEYGLGLRLPPLKLGKK